LLRCRRRLLRGRRFGVLLIEQPRDCRIRSGQELLHDQGRAASGRDGGSRLLQQLHDQLLRHELRELLWGRLRSMLPTVLHRWHA